MNYVRTFFEKPLKGGFDPETGLIALDFTGLVAIAQLPDKVVSLMFANGNSIQLAKESVGDFMAVFAGYCRDMQKLQRGAGRLASQNPNMPPGGKTKP